MRKPLQNLIITSDFRHHLASGGVRAKFAGVDFKTLPNITQVCFATEAGTIKNRVDQYGAKYIMLTGKTGTWFYVHLSEFLLPENTRVREGQVIGKCGNTGYTFGPHLHLGLFQNGKYIDPMTYLLQNKDMNKITVQAGWGISHVAEEAGFSDWSTEARWNAIAKLNGFNSYKEFRLTPGMQVTVKEALERPEINPEIASLNNKIKELTSEIDKINTQKESELLALKENTTARILELETELKELKAKEETLQNIGSEFYPELIDAFVSEVEARGLKEKYHAFVDKHLKSDYLRSLLKYDYPFVLFILFTTLITYTESFQSENKMLLAVASFGTAISTQIIKYLLTNFDKNKDGKIEKGEY